MEVQVPGLDGRKGSVKQRDTRELVTPREKRLFGHESSQEVWPQEAMHAIM
jgi:hypothetical protein